MKKSNKSKRSAAPLPTAEKLFARLRGRNKKNADVMDRNIEKLCVRELTIMMCDASGFTRRTHDYGILQFLTVMTRAYDMLTPLIVRRRGTIISHGADNILAVFEEPVQGVRAAIDMQRAMTRHNEDKSDRDQFLICIGFHHGKVLRLKDGIFGDKVNIASKIGEDLASAEEILLTGEVARHLPANIKRSYARSVELGGKNFELHRVKY